MNTIGKIALWIGAATVTAIAAMPAATLAAYWLGFPETSNAVGMTFFAIITAAS